MEDPANPDLFSPAVFKAWWERCLGVEKDKGLFLKRGVTERGKGAPSPVVAQGVGKVEDWQQAPEPELGVDLGHGAVSYTHLTLPTTLVKCRSRWSPYH